MSGLQDLILRAIKNRIVLYIGSQYLTYLLQFVNSILIAVYLGPVYLGIWGFIVLVVQYLAQMNFGISHSVNAIISINKSKEEYVIKIVGSSLWMLIGLSLFIGAIFVLNYFYQFGFGLKYEFYKYAFYVYLIAVIGYFNVLFINVFRVYGRVYEMAFNQALFPVLVLLSVLIFKGADLLVALVASNLLSFLLSFSLFVCRFPIKIKLFFSTNHFAEIQKRGRYLFVYNSSFYLIIIATRFFVSGYYPVLEFGYFTFAFSLANAILMLLQAVSFLIFPKLLNRFANGSSEAVLKILTTVRDSYMTLSHGLIHIAIFVFPYFILFFPQYSRTGDAFSYIALAVVLYANSFGYQGLLIAKGNEKVLGKAALVMLLLNIGLSYILIVVFLVPYYKVVLATLATYLVFAYIIGFFGRKLMGVSYQVRHVMEDVFPIRLMIPYLLSFFLLLFGSSTVAKIVPLILFLALNWKSLLGTKVVFKKILQDSKVIDI